MSHTMVPGKTPPISNRVYDALKWIALVALPATGVLYFGLAEIWGLPYAVQIMGTTAALDTFLGVVLGLSSQAYKNSDARFDGSLVVDTRDPNKDIYALETNEPLEDLGKSESITLKVETPPAEESQQ